MRRKKSVCIIGMILAAILFIALYFARNALASFSGALDLQGETVSPKQYEMLSQLLPNTQIQWDVPFQDGFLSSDTTQLTVTTLTREDADILITHLTKLRTLDAQDCTDYDALLYLKQQRPGIQVKYHVPIGGKTFASSAIQITLDRISQDELTLLPYLPSLKIVTVTGGNPEVLSQLWDYCHEAGLTLRIQLLGQTLSEDTEELEISGITDDALPLLYLLPNLKKVHLTEPEADGERLVALSEALSDTVVTWEKTILGVTFPQDATEIDLTEVIALGNNQIPGDKTAYQYGLDYPVLGTDEEVRSAVKVLEYHPLPDKTSSTAELIAEAEAAMAYFPKAEKLVMCGSVLDNEAMSAFREAHRGDYKVVWSVLCGDIAPRTDATFFMPTKYHVYYFKDPQMYNLRYCEDMVTIDIGHMKITDISFVTYMPNLRYLIITLTLVKDLSPLSSCKNLVFLEMDWSCVSDYSPLLDCTSLEDLNIGETFGDITPICQMTWLKNLWIVGCGVSKYYQAAEALPDTNIGAFYENPDDGWRKLPNYYIMRDNLLMYYML